MIKRYDLLQEGNYDQREGVMTEVQNGDWVSADDYDEMAQEIDRLKQVIQDAFKTLQEA